MRNYILRGTTFDGSIRVFTANTKEIYEYAKKLHNLSDFSAKEFGKMLTAGILMSATLKSDKDLLTISLKVDGEISGIVVTANSKQEIKGYVYEPQANGPLGDGSISVVKDLGLKEPIVSLGPIIDSDIEKTLNHFFETSEQVKTRFILSYDGGQFIQLMPGASEEAKAKFESGVNGEDIKIHEKLSVTFSCDCSREKALKAIIPLGKAELLDIIKIDGHINIHCHFCNSDYKFFEADVKTM
ncbi:MAG: Hsp33 family molecular chaperone HslO [Defluviitaleaceae bacterium]|nr:Hsp33 family molecular chaperone HslO [Defluviitaleaceae bacterium]